MIWNLTPQNGKQGFRSGAEEVSKHCRFMQTLLRTVLFFAFACLRPELSFFCLRPGLIY